MYFKSKKAFEEAVIKECDRRLGTEKVKRIIQVGIGDLTKGESEKLVSKLETKLKEELKLEEGSFIVVPVLGGCAGNIEVVYLS